MDHLTCLKSKSEVREAVIRTILLEEMKGGKFLIRVEIRGDVFT